MTELQRTIALAGLLAAAGLWLFLPRPSSRGKWIGGLLALAGAAIWFGSAPRLSPWLDDSVFLVLAAVTVISAALTITLVNPVYCAIWFGLSLLGTAGLFLYQGAQFLALATVVIYAGAILVTFLFVLMLAQPEGRAYYDRLSWEAMLSAATGAVLMGILAMTLHQTLAGGSPPDDPASAQARTAEILSLNHVERLGAELFSKHLIAVEAAGVLLFIALAGSTAIIVHARAARHAMQTVEAADKKMTNTPNPND